MNAPANLPTPREAAARSEALAIRIAASAYDRAVHQHGEGSAQAMIARRAFDKALIAGGFDDPCGDIEILDAELFSEAEDFHSTAAMLPDDLREVRQHRQVTGGMGNV